MLRVPYKRQMRIQDECQVTRAGHDALEIRSPKAEGRRKSEVRNPNQTFGVFRIQTNDLIRDSDFGLLSDFGLRVSAFSRHSVPISPNSSPACTPTSPSRSVRRVKFSRACRTSPASDIAPIITSYLPSGKAKRKLKVPSGRSWIGCPSTVTLAPGS